MKVKSSECFPSVFNEDFRAIMSHKFTEYTEAGGRGSCKSTFFSIVIPLLIMGNPEYNAIVLRKTENTLKDSVYNQLKWAIDKMGLESQFRFLKSPLQIVYKPTGQTIFFRGSDDPLKIKSVKAEKGYLAIVWFEELAEFTPADFESIKLSTMRGGDRFYLFESFNPPSSQRNWVNEFIRREKKDRLVHISDYRTTPEKWLGEAFIKEAEDLKIHNERSYRNVFLGEPTGTGSNIFENVELRPITEEEIDSFEYVYYGLDFGYFPDPLCYNAFSYDAQNKIIYIFDELKLLKHGNYEASEALKDHLLTVNKKQFEIFKRQHKGHGYKEEDLEAMFINILMQDRITADSAEPKSIADFRSYGWNMRGAVKGKGSLDAGMKWLQTRAKIIIDPSRCPEAADEFSLYEHEIDKRTGEILAGFPQGQADHAIAALRYGSESIWTMKGM